MVSIKHSKILLIIILSSIINLLIDCLIGYMYGIIGGAPALMLWVTIYLNTNKLIK